MSIGSTGTSGALTVLVADDHPLYRGGLVQALADRAGFCVVGEAGDGAEALRLVRELEPILALVDLRLPSLDGVAIAGEIAREGLPTRTIIVSAFEDRTTMFQAFDAGVRAYVTKQAPTTTLFETMELVAAGGLAYPSSVMPFLTEAHRRERLHSSASGALTLREREVLVLVAQGMSAPEIADQLYLSVTTIRTHIQHVYAKLGASDRAGAVAAAVRRGLID